MMGQPKSGTHRKENYNIHFKHIQIIVNFQGKEITLSVEAQIKLSISGNADSSIVWNKKYYLPRPPLEMLIIGKKLYRMLNLKIILKSTVKFQIDSKSPNSALMNYKIQIVSHRKWSSTIKTKILNFWAQVTKNHQFRQKIWKGYCLLVLSQSFKKYQTK